MATKAERIGAVCFVPGRGGPAGLGGAGRGGGRTPSPSRTLSPSRTPGTPRRAEPRGLRDAALPATGWKPAGSSLAMPKSWN